MNRKHNPWVALVGLLLGLLLVILCAGCSTEGTFRADDRFTVDRDGMSGCYIITDTETGAQYLAYKSTYGCGLTVLQTGEG